jgi:hypothetical protein
MARAESKRLVLEGFVIVSSILLAFAIDAAWDAHLERRAGIALSREIQADITNTRAEIARALRNSDDIAAMARSVLTAMGSQPATQARDSTLATIGSVFVLSAWRPTNDSYAEAIGSGRLTLLQDPEVRLALSTYQQRLANVGEIFHNIVTQYYQQQEPFMVAHTVYTDVAMAAWREGLVKAPFGTDYDVLARNRQLWNLVTLRLELEVALQSHLKRLDGLAVTALQKLAPNQ